jgi:transglutaminase-like putative cysteine protease
VTGYLVGALEGQAAFHAWAEAYDEALGWIGFDPMLQLCPTDRHVRLATGLDALGARPLRMVPADEVSELDVIVEAA